MTAFRSPRARSAAPSQAEERRAGVGEVHLEAQHLEVGRDARAAAVLRHLELLLLLADDLLRDLDLLEGEEVRVVGEDRPQRHVLARGAHVLLAEVLRVAGRADRLAEAEAPQRLAHARVAVPQVRGDRPEGLQDLGRELVDVGAVEEARGPGSAGTCRRRSPRAARRPGPASRGRAGRRGRRGCARRSGSARARGRRPGPARGARRAAGPAAARTRRAASERASHHLGFPGVMGGGPAPEDGVDERVGERGRQVRAGPPAGGRASPRPGRP